MIIYLAGGVSGNLNGYWKSYMKLYIAGIESRKWILEDMKLFLAENDGYHRSAEFLNKCSFQLKDINILESYYYLKDTEQFMELIPHFGHFLLDSGAFTFLKQNNGNSINWDNYINEYASFINKYNIKLFFELDIDNIVGIKEVERLRNKLEKLTNKKSIPVWHISRGKEYFIKMCKEYDYVALGGIAIKEVPLRTYEKYFPWFINTAHKYGTKIHGLGYTSIAGLHKYHFDSVDSTAWLYGNRGGYLYKFNPRTGTLDKFQRDGRLKAKEGALFNFNEWIKFLKYADIKL